MKTDKLEKQKEIEKDEYIKSLENALNKCLKFWGRGYEPKEDVEDTLGSLLYKECERVLNKD